MKCIRREDYRYEDEDDSERATGILNENVTEAVDFILSHQHDGLILSIRNEDKVYDIVGWTDTCDNFLYSVYSIKDTTTRLMYIFLRVYDTIIDDQRVLAFDTGKDSPWIYYIEIGDRFEAPVLTFDTKPKYYI